MSLKSFFRGVWRFNAIIIAAVSVMALAYGALAGVLLVRDLLRPRNVIVNAPVPGGADSDERVKQAEANKLRPLQFSRIAGEDVLIAPLTSHDSGRIGYYSKEATNTRDYLFYDFKTGTYHRLFGSDRQLISQLIYVAESDQPWPAPSARSAAARNTTLAMIATTISRDTNGDGRLTTTDRVDIVMSDATGRRTKTVVPDVEQLIGHTVIDEATVILMVRGEDRSTRALQVGLKDFAIKRDDRYGEPAPG